jgi:hypothetical protein
MIDLVTILFFLEVLSVKNVPTAVNADSRPFKAFPIKKQGVNILQGYNCFI